MANNNNEGSLATFVRETADAWNDSIQRWTYVENTDLSKTVGVSGYYLRIAPPETLSQDRPATKETIKICESSWEGTFLTAEIVSVDALALVRFGLRAWDDRRFSIR